MNLIKILTPILAGLCIFLFVANSACYTSPKHFTDEHLSGRYLFKDSIFILSMDLVQAADSIYGKHCFTAYSGSKIDCCLEEMSIFLKRQEDGKYLGTMKSCYDDATIGLSMIFKNDSLFFTIIDYHVFLPKNEKINFIREK